MEAKRKVSNVASVLFQHLSCVPVVLEPLDQETRLPTRILGITHHTKPSLVTGHCTHLLEHESPSFCLRVRAPQSCFSPGHHHEEKANRPHFFFLMILNVQLMFHHSTIDVLVCKPRLIPRHSPGKLCDRAIQQAAVIVEHVWKKTWLILSGHSSEQKLENCNRVAPLGPNWTVYSRTVKANIPGGPPHQSTLSFYSATHTCPFVCHSTMAPVLTSWHGLWV